MTWGMLGTNDLKDIRIIIIGYALTSCGLEVLCQVNNTLAVHIQDYWRRILSELEAFEPKLCNHPSYLHNLLNCCIGSHVYPSIKFGATVSFHSYYYYYYYFIISFPKTWTQHCNYATLLAGRWYIFTRLSLFSLS